MHITIQKLLLLSTILSTAKSQDAFCPYVDIGYPVWNDELNELTITPSPFKNAMDRGITCFQLGFTNPNNDNLNATTFYPAGQETYDPSRYFYPLTKLDSASFTISLGGYTANSQNNAPCQHHNTAEMCADSVLSFLNTIPSSLLERIDTIDWDIDGAPLEQPSRQIEDYSRKLTDTVTLLTEKMPEIKHQLSVPVSIDGLSVGTKTLIETDSGSLLPWFAWINILAFDFDPAPNDMVNAVRTAIDITKRYLNHRNVLHATVMPGIQDIKGNELTLDNAKVLSTDPTRPISSLWSLNLDKECQHNEKTISETCSGMEQDLMAFSCLFITGGEACPINDDASTSTQTDDDTKSDDFTSSISTETKAVTGTCCVLFVMLCAITARYPDNKKDHNESPRDSDPLDSSGTSDDSGSPEETSSITSYERMNP